MNLRWPLRTLTIALLTLCLSLWTGSYFHSFYIAYNPSLGKSYFAATYTGGVYFVSTNGIDTSPPGWRFEPNRKALSFNNAFIVFDKKILGFTYHKRQTRIWQLGIPFWFPSLLSATLLWSTWRQTRPKPAAQGFPVEVTQPHPPSTNFTN